MNGDAIAPLDLIQRIQQARWEFARAKGLTADEAALYAEGLITLCGEPVSR